MAIQAFPSSMPEPHRRFLRASLARLRVDSRLVGVAVGGSYLTDSMDEFSDLDLIIAVEPEQYADVMNPARDPKWIEDRFWIWVHYAATKVGRGELFEAIDCLSFMCGTVLGPLALRRAGARPAGVRRIESIAPEFARDLRRTVPSYDAADCLRALRACVELYRSLVSRTSSGPGRVEQLALEYLSEMERRCGLA